MTATAPATTSPMSVASAVNPANNGKPVTIYSEMVFTSKQRDDVVPKNEYRLSDQLYGIQRHPGTPVYADGKSPSIKLTGATGGTLDALIQTEIASSANNSWGPKDADYNAARVAVQGVLTLGTGLHDHSLEVTKIGPANDADIQGVRP